MKRPPIIIRDESLRQRVIELVGALDLGKPWQVTIEPYRKKRTLSQNALMWKWIHEVAHHVSEHTGHTEDEIHDFFKQQFLPPKIVEIGGKVSTYRTTTTLKTKEMSEYMDKIYAWATSELGLMLRLPEEMHLRTP